MAFQSLAPAAVAAVSVGGLAADDGGFFPTSWGWGAVAFLWISTVTLLLRHDPRIGRLEVACLAGLAGVTGWIALSLLWSRSTPQTVLEVERALVYPAGLLALLLVSGRRSVPALLAGALAGASGVAGANLGLRAFASPGPAPGAAAEPVGYANGLGILTGIGLLLAVGFAVRAGRPAGRLAALAALAILLPALVLSESKGAWLATALGLLTAAVLTGGRAHSRVVLTAVVAGLAAFAAVRMLPGSPRADYWRVAWQQHESAPWLGTGAGTFGRFWLQHRPVDLVATDTHSLYLEALAELGPLGLALLVVALGLPAAAAVRARRRPYVPAVLGAYAAYIVHAGIDWDWEQAGITMAAVVCAAALLLSARESRPAAALRRPGRTALTAATAALGGFALLGLLGSLALSTSSAAIGRGDWDEGARQARRAARFAPWASTPRRNLGLAQLALGRRQDALASFRKALEKDPSDYDLWLDLARAATGPERAGAPPHPAAPPRPPLSGRP